MPRKKHLRGVGQKEQRQYAGDHLRRQLTQESNYPILT